MNKISLAVEMRIAIRECRFIDLINSICQQGCLIRIGKIRLQCIHMTLDNPLGDAIMERRLWYSDGASCWANILSQTFVDRLVLLHVDRDFWTSFLANDSRWYVGEHIATSQRLPITSPYTNNCTRTDPKFSHCILGTILQLSIVRASQQEFIHCSALYIGQILLLLSHGLPLTKRLNGTALHSSKRGSFEVEPWSTLSW